MRNIAVIAGGYTSERHISLNSAKQILASINKEKYNAYMLDVRKEGFFCQLENEEVRVDLNDFSFNIGSQTVKLDFAYITLHGTPGEDGKVQAMLDLIGIPYSASGHISSVTTFDKVLCKKALSGASVYMAKSVVIKGETPFSVDQITNYVGLPCFVKPNTAGSSYGVTKVYKAEEFIDAVNLARTEDTTVIVEEFIDGVEVSCGILKTKNNEYVFPVTEIATKNDYFDTDAKYDPSLTDEITPARISDEETKKVQDFCSHIYDKLDCKGIVRIDFIIQNGKPYFLEVNSMPGMSAESIVPKQIRTMGRELGDFITEIVEDSF